MAGYTTEGIDPKRLPRDHREFVETACQHRAGLFDIVKVRHDFPDGYCVIFYKQRDGYRDIVDVIEIGNQV